MQKTSVLTICGLGLADRELLVRPVAERRVAGALAAAEPDLLRLAHAELHRLELGRLVRAVAERLAPGLPAAAPPVVTGGELHGVGRRLRNHRFGHGASPRKHWGPGSWRSACSGRGR